jgi:hypothetical protein
VAQIIMTGMGIRFLEGLVDNRGAAHHAATTPDSSHLTKGAPGTYTSRRGAAFQPRCKGGEVDKRLPQMCRGSSRACRKPSENRTQLDLRRARPPPSCAPPIPRPARRPRRAAARASRALRAALAPAWRARSAATLTPARARGVLAWRRRSSLSGKKRSCAEGAVATMGAPGAYTCICAVEQGWRPPPLANMVQVMTAQEST